MKVLFINNSETCRLDLTRLLADSDVILEMASSILDGIRLTVIDGFDCVLVHSQFGPEGLSELLSSVDQTAATIVLIKKGHESFFVKPEKQDTLDYLHWDDLSRELLLYAILSACKRKVFGQQIAHLKKQLKETESHDPLTGVLNRRGFSTQIEVEVKRADRMDNELVVLFIDFDDFKSVNNVHGYLVGDRVLQSVADLLKKIVRPTDHVARIGGDEFMVLLCDISESDAIAVAEKIEDEIRARQVVGPTGVIEISCSIGCYSLQKDEVSLDLIIHHAERALKQSKALGKDKVIFLSSKAMGLGHGKTCKQALSQVLNGLESGADLHVVAQPIVRLYDRVIVGYELCTQGLPGTYANPEDFLQLALSADRGEVVDMACLRAVQNLFKMISKLDDPAAGADPWRLHVNIFPATIKKIGIDPVIELFQEIQTLSGKTVCVELSERRLVGSPVELQSFVKRFLAEGMLIALDEVRLSRCGIEMLLFTEPTFLKVDRNLMIGSDIDSGRLRTLERLAALTAQRSIETIAGGINGGRELEVAQSLGFEMGQGYFIGNLEFWGSEQMAKIPAYSKK